MAKKELRRRARVLRKQGKTYKEIRQEIPVSKSTLSLWLRDLPKPKRNYSTGWAKAAGEGSRVRWQCIRENLLDKALEEVSSYHLDENAAAFVGTALYWAEGAKKGQLDFANSDAHMIKVYMWWLRKIIQVPVSSIAANVHVYLNGDLAYEDIRRYWSVVSRIPEGQFQQPQILTADKKKTTSKFRRILTHGVLHVRVHRPLKYRARVAALLEKFGKVHSFAEANDLS